MPPAIEDLPSLRWKLLRAVLAATLLTWILAGVFSYRQAQNEAEEMMDGHLAQTARLLLALARDNDKSTLRELEHHLLAAQGASDNIYESPLEFQVGQADGTVLLRSANAPRLSLLGLAGYSDIEHDHVTWRVLNMVAADGQYRVQVAQSITLRDWATFEVASQAVFPALFMLPLLLALLYYSVRRALRPLDDLAGDVAARTPDNLTPLPERAALREIAPLVTALNRLFSRLDKTLENERRFTADAAHELRTPLAALKVQAQVAMCSAEAPMRDHALQQIVSGVDRATRLVNQLLRLARLDPMQHLDQPHAVDLRVIVDDALHAVQPQPAQTLVDELPQQMPPVEGDADLLTIAIRNLLDNAIHYSGAASRICIAARCEDGRCALTIRDNGPGVPAAQAARLGERFWRNPDSGIEGNGLGLTIVARIAELHGGRLIAGNHPDGGFAATLADLPLAA